MNRHFHTALTWAHVLLGTPPIASAAAVAGSAGRVDWFDWCAITWSRMLVAAAGVKVEARGLEHARGLGPCVVLSTHRSHLDGPILLRTLPFHFAFVVKRQLARVPFFGWGITRGGYIPIDRRDHADAVAGMARAAEAVRRGRRVLVFPEGTRSRTGDFLPFKKGGFVLAIDAGVPILPVAVTGTADLLPSQSLAVRPGTAIVSVGAPIPTAGLTYADRERLMVEVEAEIRRLYAEASLQGVLSCAPGRRAPSTPRSRT